MSMFITPKSLPNGAVLSMDQLLATLETPKPVRKPRPAIKVTKVTTAYVEGRTVNVDTFIRELPQDQRQNKPNEQGINTIQHRGVTVAGAGKKNNGKGK